MAADRDLKLSRFRLAVTYLLAAGSALSAHRASALQTDEIFANGFGATATYYVAKNGNDTWSGTLAAPNNANSDGPFTTFDHARLVVQTLDKSNLERIFVMFRAGTYPVTSAVQFGVGDSGSELSQAVLF